MFLPLALTVCLCQPPTSLRIGVPWATRTETATASSTATSTALPPTAVIVPTDTLTPTLPEPTAAPPPLMVVDIHPRNGGMQSQIHAEATKAAGLGLVPFVEFDASW